MAWTVARIKSKIRDLTGRPSTTQLSEADLLNKINDFYIEILPNELELMPLVSWYDFNTSDGVGTQAIPSNVISLEAPVFSAGDPINLWTDDGAFFDQYPFSNTDEAEPTDVLLFDSTLYLRPIPDATYAIKIKSYVEPTSEFVLDADTPTDNQWGPFIAYGVAIEILQDAGQNAEADSLKDLYAAHKSNIGSKNLRQRPAGQRSTPSF